MSKHKLFTSQDGKSLLVPFILVSSLFLLWGFCNGMIDLMDKHFQKELHLTLAQSAWVQFAHYLGYFLMAMPAGWLAGKLGYKGGIIAGLLMVAIGGFWFIPATRIETFPAFLLGVCHCVRADIFRNRRESLHHRAGTQTVRRAMRDLRLFHQLNDFADSHVSRLMADRLVQCMV